MKTIWEQNALLKNVLGNQKYNETKNYRFITYSTVVVFKDKFLLFNTLTRQLIVLNKEEYNSVKNNYRNDLYINLVNQYFLVPESFDDESLYEQVKNLTKMFDGKKGLTHFVILPTTDCNARCFYCFEHGAKRQNMTNITAEDVADFIIKKSLGQKVKLHWFGGEPLYNVVAIDIITDILHKNNIEFSSTMVSNGYLFNEKTVMRAKIKWNFKGVQITLDGTEEIYNRIKAYIYKDETNPFERVLNNIELLLKEGITVSIRLNMDERNKNDLYDLVDLLADRYSNYKSRLFIYASLIYDNSRAANGILKKEISNELYLDLIKLKQYIFEKGYTLNDLPKKQIPINACLADSQHSIIILPDGSLGKCDHYSDSELIGNIYNDKHDLDVINSWNEIMEPIANCKTCPLKPQCLKLKKCPHKGGRNCNAYEQKEKLSALHRQIINAYDKFEQ